MAKELYLVRHAKSSWKDSSLSDHDRPLNKRGRHDAPLMAKLTRKAGAKPDLLLSSTALRAKMTAQAFAEEFDLSGKRFKLSERLYMAGTKDFMSEIRNLDEELETVMMFSHNPGITDFVNRLAETDIINIPTCGVCRIRLNSSWADTELGNGELIKFDFPKNHYDH